VTVEGSPTGGSFTLTFGGETSEAIPFDATSEQVGTALRSLPGLRTVVPLVVDGGVGGPYTVYFGGGKSEPLLSGDGSGLVPAGGKVSVATVVGGGESYAVNYRFEYVPQEGLEMGDFAHASFTSEERVEPGDRFEFFGQDVSGLVPGETYDYRLVSSSTAPGGGTVGSVQYVTVPGVGSSVQGPCPNESLRTGASANLPDCRAYELVTPVDKEGAQEIFRYEGLATTADATVGEDGDHVVLDAPAVSWRSGATSGLSPYLFSREADEWGMTPGTPEPEAGIDTYTPRLYSSDATQIALESRYNTSAGSESKDVEFKEGPVGGPYLVAASVPVGDSGNNQGWVAASPDFSKLVLEVEDHQLTGTRTTT
jgi:hypothetical protein